MSKTSKAHCQTIIKYLLISLVSILILSILPSKPFSTESILTITLIIIGVLFMNDQLLILSKSEGMTVIAENNVLKNWFSSYVNPQNNITDSYEPDYFKSGFEYDHNMPGYYLSNNGKFSETGINYDKVNKLIEESKGRHIHNQYNIDLNLEPSNEKSLECESCK